MRFYGITDAEYVESPRVCEQPNHIVISLMELTVFYSKFGSWNKANWKMPVCLFRVVIVTTKLPCDKLVTEFCLGTPAYVGWDTLLP